MKTKNSPGQKMTKDGRYRILNTHNCGCEVLQPLGASYAIVGYCNLHRAAKDLLVILKSQHSALLAKIYKGSSAEEAVKFHRDMMPNCASCTTIAKAEAR